MKSIAIVLCGGSGSRLWPLSVDTKPKQFHAIFGEDSLFASTIRRAQQLDDVEAIVVVASSEHKQSLAQHAEPFTGKPLHYLLEPMPRNTAAAISCAAQYVFHHMGRQEPTCLLVMPSDHYIPDQSAFNSSIKHAIVAAERNYITTIGVQPTKPATGYGYIQQGESISDTDCHAVMRFVEKPSLKVAEQLIADPQYLWNSGIFILQVSTLLTEMKKYAPAVASASELAVKNGKALQGYFFLDKEALQACPSVSFDYAVMERSTNIAVTKMQGDWSDVGSWDAVSELDAMRGKTAPSQSVMLHQANRNYVKASKKIALIGVDDLIVVETADGILVCKKGFSESLKQALEKSIQGSANSGD